VPATEQWVSSIVQPYATAEGGALAQVATAAVENFKSQLPEEARAILAKSGDKDFALDMQNIILAFAGRVLLRKADVRFERGHRYGLIGQNGTGKTTLLNRLAAKDINGFPQELRTWYVSPHPSPHPSPPLATPLPTSPHPSRYPSPPLSPPLPPPPHLSPPLPTSPHPSQPLATPLPIPPLTPRHTSPHPVRYIRHEVLCDDGIDVRTFLKDKSPAKVL